MTIFIEINGQRFEVVDHDLKTTAGVPFPVGNSAQHIVYSPGYAIIELHGKLKPV